MSDDSPLFVSSIELLAHAAELYTGGNERKYKFAILHLANAIELILKDRLVDAGVSIYVANRPQTISIWESFQKLEEIDIRVQERPIIELLVDDRNTIQHRFGFPNSETVFFYLKRIVAFFRRFLEEEYAVALVDVLSPYLESGDLVLLGLKEEEQDHYIQLDRLFQLSPESAIIQAYSLLEHKFRCLIIGDFDSARQASLFWRAPDFPSLLDDLAIQGYITHETAQRFDLLRQLRNRAAHVAHSEEEPALPWEEAFQVAKNLLIGLDRAIDEDFRSKRATRRGFPDYDQPTDNSDSGDIDDGAPDVGGNDLPN